MRQQTTGTRVDALERRVSRIPCAAVGAASLISGTFVAACAAAGMAPGRTAWLDGIALPAVRVVAGTILAVLVGLMAWPMGSRAVGDLARFARRADALGWRALLLGALVSWCLFAVGMVSAGLLGLATGPQAAASAEAVAGTRATERFLYGTSAIVQSCAALALAAAVLFQLSRPRDERESLRSMLGFPAMPLAASGAAVACAGGVLLFVVPSWLVLLVGALTAAGMIRLLRGWDFLTPTSQRLALFLAWLPAPLALVPLLARPGVRGLLMMLGVAQSPPPLGEAAALLALGCSFVGVLGLAAAAVVATVQWMSVAWAEEEVGEAAADLFVAMLKQQLGRGDARGLADTLQKLSRWAEVAEPVEAASVLLRLAEREEGGLRVDQAAGQHIERLLLEEPKELLAYGAGADNLAHSLARLTVNAPGVLPLTYRKLLRPFLRAALPRSGEIGEVGRALGVERGLTVFLGTVARQLSEGGERRWAQEVASLFDDARKLSRETQPHGEYSKLMGSVEPDKREHAELLLADGIVEVFASEGSEVSYRKGNTPGGRPASDGEEQAHWAAGFLRSLLWWLWQYDKADWAVYIAFECATRVPALGDAAAEEIEHSASAAPAAARWLAQEAWGEDLGKVARLGMTWWAMRDDSPTEEQLRSLGTAVQLCYAEGFAFVGELTEVMAQPWASESRRLRATVIERGALFPFQYDAEGEGSLTHAEFRCLRYTEPNRPGRVRPISSWPLALPVAWRTNMALRHPDEDSSFRSYFAPDWTRLTRPMRSWFMWYLGDTWARERAVEGAMNLQGLFGESLEEDEFRSKCEEIIRFYLRTAFERDTDIDVRHEAAAALAELDDEEGWQFLVQGARDPDDKRRAWACLGLGRSGRKEAAAILLERLGDSAEAVRQVAAQALGALRAKEAVQPLAEVLNNGAEAEGVRGAAAQALGAIGGPAAVEALEAALQAELPERLRQKVEAALKEARRPRPDLDD